MLGSPVITSYMSMYFVSFVFRIFYEIVNHCRCRSISRPATPSTRERRFLPTCTSHRQESLWLKCLIWPESARDCNGSERNAKWVHQLILLKLASTLASKVARISVLWSPYLSNLLFSLSTSSSQFLARFLFLLLSLSSLSLFLVSLRASISCVGILGWLQYIGLIYLSKRQKVWSKFEFLIDHWSLFNYRC